MKNWKVLWTFAIRTNFIIKKYFARDSSLSGGIWSLNQRPKRGGFFTSRFAPPRLYFLFFIPAPPRPDSPPRFSLWYIHIYVCELFYDSSNNSSLSVKTILCFLFFSFFFHMVSITFVLDLNYYHFKRDTTNIVMPSNTYQMNATILTEAVNRNSVGNNSLLLCS